MGGMERMIRRFVNIVVERRSSDMYTLHRLDVSKHLFFPSTAAAEAANKTNGKVSILPWLPAPTMRFEPSPTTLWDAGKLEMFALVSPRSCEDRILCSNTAGHTTLYDAYWGWFMPMAISVARPGASEEDLYVMNTSVDLGYGLSSFADLRNGPSSFDVLRFGSLGSDRGWRWDPLPPPPFAGNVRSYTVVDGGSTICVSTREWRQAGGGWVLPFDGAAEYVPDLKLWMGFSSSDSQQLCAWDLSGVAKDDKPPTLEHSWTDLKTPKEWSPSRISLINLGKGWFCIAKTFRVVNGDDGGESFHLDSVEDKFAVLTGIQMVNRGGGQDDQEGIEMIRHKSIRYMFTDEMIRWVL
ncbi:hypothetical protein HU200_039398 [Digitaria exilis]|uniref:Uncharacterized protein n=1 Tax=Digitaria exilis TaxID=1010633 RepID=A0A835BMG1_9POAL|nr:hypothetical protein HU200_039398 [Digitaria exilis]